MRIAVTGASGHIGINLIPELIIAGHDVRILSHRNEKILEEFTVPVINGDLLDPFSLNEFIYGAEIIIHLGAVVTIHKKSPEALKVNIEGTRNLLSAGKKAGVKKFIFFSSIHSLQAFPLDDVLDESRPYNTGSPFDYDRSKVAGEQMVLEAREDNFETIILNPTSVVGPRDYRPSLMGRAIIQLYRGSIPALLRGGFNWVDVRDVVKATLAAVSRKMSENKFLIAGNWHSMTELGEVVAASGGKPCPKMLIPFWLAYFGAGAMSLMPWIRKEEQLFTTASLHTLQYAHKNISSAKAGEFLDFHPRPLKKQSQIQFSFSNKSNTCNKWKSGYFTVLFISGSRWRQWYF